MPRKYSMERRTASVDETRQRIVDATVALHNEKGVLATTMQDIAARASVSLGTVYRHFPTIDDLIPACGGRNLELNPPPGSHAFDHLTSAEERIAALVAALYAHYERGERPYEIGFEAMGLPVMARMMTELADHLRDLVTEALRPTHPDGGRLNLAVGLCDFRVWRSLTQAGLSTPNAAAYIGQLLREALAAPALETKGGE